MLAVGAKLIEAPVVDRRDHPAERLADPAEGDALLDRHPRASLPRRGCRAKCDEPVPFPGHGGRHSGGSPASASLSCAAPFSMTYRERSDTGAAANASKILLAAGRARTLRGDRVLSPAGYVFTVAASAPALSSLKPIDQGTSSAVYAADGSRLGFIQSDEIRTPIPLNRIPESMQAATIAIEDERFYQHGGVDYEGILRAAFKNLEAGKTVEGGSTITQQLVRNLYVGRERTLAAQDPGGAPRGGARAEALQALDPAELSELGALRDRRRTDRGRRTGGGRDLLRQAGEGPDARGVGAPRRACRRRRAS